MTNQRLTPGLLIGAIVFAIVLALCVAAVAHAEDTQADTHGIGITGNWPTTCTPQGMHSIVNDGQRIVQVWQETPAEDCTPGLTPWHATLMLPAGDWTVQWTIDARDGSDPRWLDFFVRDHTIQRHHVFLPEVH